MKDGSSEQLAENAARQIMECRDKIIDDFYKAYAAQLMINGQIDLTDICLVEHQCDGPHSFNRKYWFEYKPKFDCGDGEV